MATLRSLGVHTPAALPYLIAESILPEDASEKDYDWTTYSLVANGEVAEEELLWTEYCVVWSRGGVVQKVFNFEMEQQKITQAVLTWFPVYEATGSPSLHAQEQRSWQAQQETFAPTDREDRTADNGDQNRERALVVFLKLQAHIFFLRGSNHVVNLPFEVEKAFPTPDGLILQRRMTTASFAPPTPAMPPAPPNSFFSSQQALSQPSFLLHSSFSNSRKQKHTKPSTTSRFLDGLLKEANAPLDDNLPRFFSFTDPLSELGLVVDATPNPHLNVSQQSHIDSLLEPLDRSEELIYVSTETEIPRDKAAQDEPLIICVTANYQLRRYSIWNVSFSTFKSSPSSRKQRESLLPSIKVRRRSSYGPTPGTGTTTPGLRGGVMESFASRVYPEGGIGRTKTRRGKSSAEDEFASQVDPEYPGLVQPAKESRRVSSLLSRADLNTSFDKNAFQDLATQRTSFGASFGSQARRGASFGGYGDRMSLGKNARVSSPGSVARLSLGTVSLEDTFDEDLEDTFDESEESEHNPFEMAKGLKREVMMAKITDVPFGDSAPIFTTSFVSNPEPPKVTSKVFTLSAFDSNIGSKSRRPVLFVHIVDQPSQGHVQVELKVQTKKKPKRYSSTLAPSITIESGDVLIPEVGRIDKIKGHLDAVKVSDKGIESMLCLSRGPSGQYQLSLHSEYGSYLPLELAMGQLKLFNPYSLSGMTPASRKNAGLQRTLQAFREIRGFESPSYDGIFDLVDGEGRHHRLQLQLAPLNNSVRLIFSLLRAIFPAPVADLLISTWWSILRIIQEEEGYDKEWLALASTIFTLPMAFAAEHNHAKSNPATRNLAEKTRRSFTRSPSGSGDSNEIWQLMWSCENRRELSIQNSSAWDWTAVPGVNRNSQDLSSGQDSPPLNGTSQKNDFVIASINLSRQFLKSPLGKGSSNLWRRMSTTKGQDVRSLYMSQALVALHLLREEEKLNAFSQQSGLPAGYFTSILAQMGHWLKWEGWTWKRGDYYNLDLADAEQWTFDDSSIVVDTSYSPPWEQPPSIFSWVDSVFTHGSQVAFPTIDLLLGNDKIPAKSPKISSTTLTKFTPRTMALSRLFTSLTKESRSSIAVIESAVGANIDLHLLETLPDAFAMHLQEAIKICQPSPPTTWPASLLYLVGREDLNTVHSKEQNWKQNPALLIEPARDVHTLCQLADQPPPLSNAHPEHDRLQTSKLIFSQDRRYIEAIKLLDPTRQNVAECTPDPSWSEAEYLDAQKGVMQWVMLRTFALPPGNSMMHYNVRRPLPTEKYQLHGFSTSCLMKPMNNIVTADRTSFTEEKFGWAFFHAGVNHGLTISKDAKGIDNSWVVFNKPADLTNKHAGLMLGLGLNGHLKKLAKWQAFKYLTTKHTMTTVGLLLGFSASYLGTMDTLVTRMISIHVTKMLPVGAAELNNSPLVQTTGLMGIGLLYCGTQHRRMSEIMLSEIEYIELTDPSEPPDALRDECYRLSAGFALGLINVGKGKDLRGLHDMRIVERLLAVAVGTKPVDVVHIIDQATAGATIAIAIIFMKTHDEAIARKIDVPDTLPQFDYVRPDIFLLRTLAKHLIMWNRIRADFQWMIMNLPRAYQEDYDLKRIKTLRSEHMPFYNIIAGLLWSIGLRHAGSGNIEVRDFLIQYLDQFIRLCRIPALRYDAKLTRNTVRNCQDLVALSAATVMAGTGDLDVLRRLRALHGRVGSEIPYGSHLASHFAIGALFMAGGHYTFGTSNVAIAALVCAFYPVFPMDVLDNKAHLQAFRHLWVLAAEPRCIVIRDVDTQKAISLPIEVQLKDGTVLKLNAPCLLPEIDTIGMIRTASPEYWQVALDFVKNPSHLTAFQATQTVYVRHRPSREAYSSLFSATLASLNASAIASSSAQSTWNGLLKFDWLFKLPVFSEFDKADWETILPVDNNNNNASVNLSVRTTALDTRLVLDEYTAGKTRDDLMALKVLFSWAERMTKDRGNAGPKSVEREVIGRLRKQILERGRGIGSRV